MTWEAWQTFDLTRMYVGLVIISILGWLTTLIADELESLIVPWRRGR